MFALLRILLMLLIAISAIRSIVRFAQKLWFEVQPPRAVSRANSSGDAAATALRQDPVCGTYVAVDTSLKRIVHGRVVHFCSPECRDRYTV
jgi:YHS domain-containing protein